MSLKEHKDRTSGLMEIYFLFWLGYGWLYYNLFAPLFMQVLREAQTSDV